MVATICKDILTQFLISDFSYGILIDQQYKLSVLAGTYVEPRTFG